MESAISIVEDDITSSTAEAIVNAANPTMLGGGGVDGAIHRAAGPELREHCQHLPVVNGVRCPIGMARITPAGQLKARWVIHAVGPRYTDDPEPEKLLASAYRSSLLLAQLYTCRSIAFPAISCGIFGYPHQEAAEVALSTCLNATWSDMEIAIHLFPAEPVTTDIWWQTLARLA